MKNAFCILFLSLCISNFADSQGNDTLSHNKFSYALRGKIFGGFIIEDIYFGTYTLGNELIFKDRHSLGLDFTFFRWRMETDDDTDRAMYENYQRRTYLYADYRYKIIQFENHQFYFSLYDKFYGRYKEWGKALDYDFDIDTSFLRSETKGTFNEAGLGLGWKVYFDGSDSGLGLDLNAQIGKRFGNNDILTINQGVSTFKEDEKTEKTVFYMRLNLFYKFKRQEKKPREKM